MTGRQAVALALAAALAVLLWRRREVVTVTLDYGVVGADPLADTLDF